MNKLAKELLKRNNSREKAISDDSKEIYTNMVVYLRGSDLTEYNQEVVREDIIELIIDGQQRGDDIQKVMGGGYKEICDEIIEAMPKKTKKDKITETAGISLNALWVLGVIALVKNLINSVISDAADFRFILTAGDIITIVAIILIAYMIVLFITKTAFETKKNNKVISFLKMWAVATGIFAVLILSSLYFKTIIVSIPLWIAAILVTFIFITEKIVSKRT